MKALTIIALFIVLPNAHLMGQQMLVPIHFHHDHSTAPHTVIDDNDRLLIAQSLESSEDVLVFDLEVQNLSLKSLEVDPSRMVMMAHDRPFPTLSREGPEQVRAFEQSINAHRALSMDEVTDTYQRKIRERRGLGIALTALATGLAVYDAVKDAGDWSKEFWTAADLQRHRARDAGVIAAFFISDGARHLIAGANAKTDEEMQYLDQEILTPTLLEPMEAVRGKVFFPEKRSKYYRLIVPLKGAEYVFDFRKPGRRDRRALRKLDQ